MSDPEKEPKKTDEESKPEQPTTAQPQAASPYALVGVLTAVCCGAGIALAGGHVATNRQIAKQRYMFKLASVKKVLPRCDNDPGKDTVDVALPGGKKATIYRCRKGGKVSAVAFSLDSGPNKMSPYSGTIEVLVGIGVKDQEVFHDKKAKRVGVLILKHSETPGLGAKIEEYDYLKQYGLRRLDKEGRSCIPTAGCRKWAVTKDDATGFVDSISGATISSRAVTEIVQRAMGYFGRPEVRKNMIREAIAKPATRPALSR